MSASGADVRLSVLFVCQHDFAGPSEKQMMGFAQRLAQRGHRVLFSVGGSADSMRSEGLRACHGIGVVEHRFQGRRLRRADRAAVADFRPSLIHAVNSRVPTAAAAADYSRATGAPLFVHFEDNEWSAWRGVPGESLYYRFGRQVRHLESFIHPTSWPHSTAATRRWVRRSATGLDALTPELSGEVSLRLGRACTTVLPVTPELDEVETAEAPELPAPVARLPMAVVTGTIYPFSLEDTMQGLRAVAEVQRRGYEIGYVHPGNVHPRIDPLALAAEAGLAHGTYAFPGMVPFAAVPQLLRRAAVLLQPGGPTEFNRLRLPSKLQAYLESGTPTITFATGFGELLGDREEVLKIYTDAPAELADRIVEVLTDAQLRDGLRRGGPRAAQRLFDPERNTEALLAHYRQHLPAMNGERL